MFSVTGPVMRSPSAWRGEATYWIPNRPTSQPTVPRTLTSELQALQSPALTTRRFRERPNSRQSFPSRASASGSTCPVRTRSSRRRVASRVSCVNAIAASGQAVTHSTQKRHRPRSSASGPSLAMASVGQTSAHDRHPSGHFAGSSAGSPRNRSGIGGGAPAGYAIVRWPWCARARSAFNMGSLSQVVAAIGQVEALVAERKIRDLAIPQRERESEPVVERRVDDLVAGKASGRVRHRDVADLPAPAFRERDDERVRPHRPGRGALPVRRQPVELAQDERDRLLNLEPADVRAGVDVTVMRGHHGKVDEAVDARGKVVPHVPLDPARTRRGPDEPEGPRVVRADGAGALETLPRPRSVRPSRSPASVTSVRATVRRDLRSRTWSDERSNPTPPGRTSPRPKREPQSSAVMFRKSPRNRPQYDAVGR